MVLARHVLAVDSVDPVPEGARQMLLARRSETNKSGLGQSIFI